jgi:glycosyltransferase involved in cell wall biosynthesis
MIPEEVPVKPGPLGADSQLDEIGRVIGEAGHRQPVAQASPVRGIAMTSDEGTVPTGRAVAATETRGNLAKPSKLKIIQTPVRFFPAYGGVEKYVLELSKQLVALGNDVTVVCADEPHTESCAVHGVKAIRLPYIAKVANTNITPRLFSTLMSESFDVIHTHIPTPWSADFSALVSLLRKKRLFVTYHDDLTGQGVNGLVAHLYNSTFLHLVLWRADKIVITQPKYLEHSRHLRLHKRKLIIIPPGVTKPLTVPGIKRKADQVFFMSVLDRYHEYKGLGILLEAMVKVKDKRPEARLMIGGGGQLIGKYEQLAEMLGLSDSVEFLGYIPDQELAELYSSSSVFVLPSLNKLEGFGIVALEALSYATPVITTDIAGSSDLITRNKAGLIVPPGDAVVLANAITTLLGDRSEAQSMGIRGAAAVNREFGWDSIARRMLNAY